MIKLQVFALLDHIVCSNPSLKSDGKNYWLFNAINIKSEETNTKKEKEKINHELKGK